MSPAPDFRYDVFISHATKDDAALIDRIAQGLTAAGLQVYVDHQRLQPGDEWDQEIQTALQHSRTGLLALSPASLASPECLGEWRYILNQKRRLYVARIAPVDLQDFHSRLCVIQYADLVGDSFREGLAALVQAISSAYAPLSAASPAVRVEQAGSSPFPHDQLDLPIFGRDEPLAALAAELLRQHPVTITGIGGVGKTKLAATLAATGAFIDGVLWHRLPAAADPAQARLGLDALTAELRDYLRLPLSTPEAQTWNALGEKQLLLVLDNAEDCLHPQPYAERLLALRQARAAVLLTSRHRWPELKNRDHEYPLAVPEAEAAEAILAAMVQRAGGGTKPLSATDLRELAAAARYHPRLLEFVSGWLKNYPAAWVLRRLHDLQGRDIEAALREVVGQTLDLVAQTPDGPQALADLSKLKVYTGGFTIEAAEALLPATYEASIPLLRDWHLLRFDSPRYDLDPLVAAAIDTDEAAYPVHYEYYKALAQEHNKRQDYVCLVPELINIESAFERALQTEEIEKAYWLANISYPVLHNRGRFVQWLQWLQKVEATLPKTTSERVKAALSVSLGVSYAAQVVGNQTTNLRRAIDAYLAALHYYTEQTSPVSFAITQNNLGIVYRDLSDIEDPEINLRRSIVAYLAALRYRAEKDFPLAFAMTQNNLGNAYASLSRIEEREVNLRRAIEAYLAALRHYTEQAAPLTFATTQNNLGITYTDLAQVEEQEINLRRSINAFLASLRYRTEQAAPFDFAVTQNNLGNAYRSLAQVEKHEANLQYAIDAYVDALRVADAVGAINQVAHICHNLGNTWADLGNLSNAIQCWQKAQVSFQQLDDLPSAQQMQAWIAEAEEALRQQPPSA